MRGGEASPASGETVQRRARWALVVKAVFVFFLVFLVAYNFYGYIAEACASIGESVVVENGVVVNKGVYWVVLKGARGVEVVLAPGSSARLPEGSYAASPCLSYCIVRLGCSIEVFVAGG